MKIPLLKIEAAIAIAALVCTMGVSRVTAAPGGGKDPVPGSSARQQAPSQTPAPPPTAKVSKAQKIGTVIALEGSVSVILADGNIPTPLNVNDPVSLGDRILTGGESEASLRFADNTEFSLADNTDFTVDDYVYDPDKPKDNRASYEIIEGMCKYVGGSIGRSDDAIVNIDTPVGLIRIRGAEFIVESDGTPDILEIALISESIALTPRGDSERPAPTAGPPMAGPLQIQVTRDGTQSLPMTRAQYNAMLAQYFPAVPTP